MTIKPAANLHDQHDAMMRACSLPTYGELVERNAKLVEALNRWDEFMRNNYKPEDISWWDKQTALLRELGEAN